jgi:hypothetical protein
MSIWTKRFIGFAAVLTLGLILAACQTATQVAVPTDGPGPIVIPTCPAAQPCPTAAPGEAGIQAPFEEAWAASPHNDVDSPAFTYWDESETKTIPAACAACHSTPGYQDYLGADGTEAGKVEAPHAIGTTVTCDACHNQVAAGLNTVSFLSGVEVTGLGPEARCMVCHQGRATKVQVDAQIESFNAEDPDAVVAPRQEGDRTVNFGFINVHYYAAAVTLYGTEVKGGYEYEGNVYDAKFDHVEGYNTCVGCHNPHTTEVKVSECALCHEGVATVDDLKEIRMISSASDYDGDGNVTEGIYDEMNGLRDVLFGAIESYATDVAGTGILYDSAAYPYFFADSDNNGQADTNDQGRAVGYNTWTPRLLKAAYNFQVSLKDPGAYAHGNKYIIQLMHDSIVDLNESLSTQVDLTTFGRDDAGHFAGNTEAFRHWDAEEMIVPAACAKCHTATGLPQFIAEGTNIRNHASNGFLCATCHDESNWPATFALKEVTFPSGAKVSFGEGNANNLCLACHQGRESTNSVDNALRTFTNPNEASDQIRFRNIHYFAAGATLFGSEVRGIYQYANKEYAGRFEHVPGFDTCASCHDPHVLTVNVQACAGCHQGAAPEDIRMPTTTQDFDGDGDVTEGLKGELDTYTERLWEAIQAYATTNTQGILYDSHAYPYFFLDANNDGQADRNDQGAAIGYNAFTPNLMRAAYNYQYAQKDPGAYVHNARYVMQALYDSIESLGGRVTGLVRPTND